MGDLVRPAGRDGRRAPARDASNPRSTARAARPRGVSPRRPRGRGRVGRRGGAAAAGGATTVAGGAATVAGGAAGVAGGAAAVAGGAAVAAAGAALHGRGRARPPRHRGDRCPGPAHPGPPRGGSPDRGGWCRTPGGASAARAGAAGLVCRSGTPHHRRRRLDEPGRPARPALRLRVRPVAHHPAERGGRPPGGGAVPPHPGPARRPRGALRPSRSRRPRGVHERRGPGDRSAAEPVGSARVGPLHRHRRDSGVRGVRDRPWQPGGPPERPSATQ